MTNAQRNNGWAGLLAVAISTLAAALTSPAQTFTSIHSFDFSNGTQPYAGLLQATDGNFYGTTYSGGANSAGTVYKITSNGTLTRLYNFCAQADCADGWEPYAALVQGTDGDFYGRTWQGGTHSLVAFARGITRRAALERYPPEQRGPQAPATPGSPPSG